MLSAFSKAADPTIESLCGRALVKVFISYAREDIQVVRRIHTFLSSIEELSPWFDTANLSPGEDWREAIFTAIENSSLFILVLSRVAFERKRFLHEEIAAALERQASMPANQPFIIPVRLDDCELSGELGRIETIDLASDWDAGIERLRSTVTRQLTSSVADAIGSIKEYWTLESRARWIQDHGDFLLQFSSTTVLRYLNDKYEHYEDEVSAIQLMIEITQAARNESLSSYVLRLQEIARIAHNYPIESSAACAAFLDASKILPTNLQGVLLRNSLNAWLELGAVWGNTFTPCLILLDVAKHYLAQHDGRHQSDFEIAKMCLPVLGRYDLLALDLLIFYSRRSGEYGDLLASVSLLQAHFDIDIMAQIPDHSTKDALLHKTLTLSSIERVLSFASSPKMAMLLVRVGECLGRSNDDQVCEYGGKLKRFGIERLGRHRVESSVIEVLNSAASAQFVEALELHDGPTLASLLNVEEISTMYLIEEMMITICSYVAPSTKQLRYPNINSNAFRERYSGLIGFRK